MPENTQAQGFELMQRLGRGEKYILRLDPRYLHTVPNFVLEWNGKEVTVESWHELWPTTHAAQLFPNETRVGFVLEFMRDIPACELELA